MCGAVPIVRRLALLSLGLAVIVGGRCALLLTREAGESFNSIICAMFLFGLLASSSTTVTSGLCKLFKGAWRVIGQPMTVLTAIMAAIVVVARTVFHLIKPRTRSGFNIVYLELCIAAILTHIPHIFEDQRMVQILDCICRVCTSVMILTLLLTIVPLTIVFAYILVDPAHGNSQDAHKGTPNSQPSTRDDHAPSPSPFSGVVKKRLADELTCYMKTRLGECTAPTLDKVLHAASCLMRTYKSGGLVETKDAIKSMTRPFEEVLRLSHSPRHITPALVAAILLDDYASSRGGEKQLTPLPALPTTVEAVWDTACYRFLCFCTSMRILCKQFARLLYNLTHPRTWLIPTARALLFIVNSIRGTSRYVCHSAYLATCAVMMHVLVMPLCIMWGTVFDVLSLLWIISYDLTVLFSDCVALAVCGVRETAYNKLRHGLREIVGSLVREAIDEQLGPLKDMNKVVQETKTAVKKLQKDISKLPTSKGINSKLALLKNQIAAASDTKLDKAVKDLSDTFEQLLKDLPEFMTVETMVIRMAEVERTLSEYLDRKRIPEVDRRLKKMVDKTLKGYLKRNELPPLRQQLMERFDDTAQSLSDELGRTNTCITKRFGDIWRAHNKEVVKTLKARTKLNEEVNQTMEAIRKATAYANADLGSLRIRFGALAAEARVHFGPLIDAFRDAYEQVGVAENVQHLAARKKELDDQLEKWRLDQLNNNGYGIVQVVGQGAFGRVATLKDQGGNVNFVAKMGRDVGEWGYNNGYRHERRIMKALLNHGVPMPQLVDNGPTALGRVMGYDGEIYYPWVIMQEYLGDPYRTFTKFVEEIHDSTNTNYGFYQRNIVLFFKFVFHRLCNALQCMHNAGYTHRDLKPDNVFVHYLHYFANNAFDIRVKLIDVGMTVKSSEQCPFLGGTPDYQSPKERAAFHTSNDRAPGVTGDIWALVPMALYFFNGRFDYPHASVQSTLNRLDAHVGCTASNTYHYDRHLQTVLSLKLEEMLDNTPVLQTELGIKQALVDCMADNCVMPFLTL